MAAISFPDLSSPAGLKHLDDYLLSRSYISWHQASIDDLVVFCAIKEEPNADFVNASRWYKHIRALVGRCFPGSGVGVQIEGFAPPLQSRELPVEPVPDALEPSPAPPLDRAVKAEDSDEDLDLFGEETEEEKKAAAEREEKIKTSAKKKESGKSSVLLEVKPWDDETDMQKLEEAVRSVSMPGLLWGASKLVPVGYGIRKLQIMMTIVDDLVSVDNLVEDYLLVEPRNEHIQSCDIVAFNKI